MSDRDMPRLFQDDGRYRSEGTSTLPPPVMRTRRETVTKLDHAEPNRSREAGYRSAASERLHKLARYFILLAT
jgi:hypothetical protein